VIKALLKTALVAVSIATTLPPVGASAGAVVGPYEASIFACVRPLEFVKKGQLSGHGAVALVMCNGGSAAGSSVKLFVNFGPQRGGTVYLGEMFGGDHMNVFFAGGYAYVTSALHGPDGDPSACVQCYTMMLVQRVSTREQIESPGPLLVDGGITIVQLSSKSDYQVQAQTGQYKSSTFFGNERLQSSKFITAAKEIK
jgi:hypothetical protein